MNLMLISITSHPTPVVCLGRSVMRGRSQPPQLWNLLVQHPLQVLQLSHTHRGEIGQSQLPQAMPQWITFPLPHPPKNSYLAHLLGMHALERSEELLGREELLLRVLQIGGIEPPHPPPCQAPWRQQGPPSIAAARSGTRPAPPMPSPTTAMTPPGCGSPKAASKTATVRPW